MSKIIEEYLRLKKKNKEALYLFKIGNFYTFIGEDADKINDYMVLKKTNFSGEYQKCGFPIDRIEAYERVFQKQNINVIRIDDINNIGVLHELKNIDLDKLNRKEAIELLKEIKEYYD